MPAVAIPSNLAAKRVAKVRLRLFRLRTSGERGAEDVFTAVWDDPSAPFEASDTLPHGRKVFDIEAPTKQDAISVLEETMRDFQLELASQWETLEFSEAL